MGRFSHIWQEKRHGKKILKISTLIYFWLPTGTKCRKYDPIFFLTFFKLWQLKKIQ
jgi:hypothetical protein